MSDSPRYLRYFIALGLLLVVAGGSLSQLCLQRPTLVTLVDPQTASTMKLTDNKFILGPVMGSNMLVVEKENLQLTSTDFPTAGTPRN